MSQLAKYLIAEVPARAAHLSLSSKVIWQDTSRLLDTGSSLEAALLTVSIPDELVEVLTEVIAECVAAAEEVAVADILGHASISAFGRLLLFALRASPALDVVTTNYDRLVEVQAARAGVRVDSTFYGHTVGRLDPQLSRDELLQVYRSSGRSQKVGFSSRSHIRLSKPHGSLDWFTQSGQHYRTDLPLGGARRIVAPGGNKYRLGYEVPFDIHRARANEAIDKASALLFLGYGFNDDHLQTHIIERMPHVPTVIVSKQLTEKALEYLSLSVSAMGIEAATSESESRIVIGSRSNTLPEPLWDLSYLVKEALAS
ncbi:SIR2 family protein [Clavibacter sp. km3a]|uniref:SIR2 family protein n=1 Tax=Clavibacter sp. km3a TaxID=3459135 RepID=UPI004041BCF3